MNPQQNVTQWMNEEMLIPENIDLSAYMSSEDKYKIKNAPEFREQLKEHYLNPQQAQGLTLPWIAAKDFRIRPGESTIHTGYNGHRKSMMLGLIQLALIGQDAVCLGVSLEMRPHITLDRMLKQFTGDKEPNLSTHDRYFEFLNQKLFLYDQVGTVKWQRALAVARYAIEKLGVTQVFYDSLMKLGIKKKDLETQAEFVDEMTTLGKDTGAHFHLVAHSNKPAEYNENKAPTKYDISGSSDLSNMVDNVVVHFKESRPEKAYSQLMIVEKQRNPSGNDPEPAISFDFDDDNLQFQRDHMRYRPDDWELARWS